MKLLFGILCGICVFFTISVLIFQFYLGYKFNQNCMGYLKRAADANTVQIAINELKKVCNYLEENNKTHGSSHTIFKMPKHDVGFWYNNILESKKELEALPQNATSLEKSNTLMKLRETLMDDEFVTVPPAIALFPNQVIMNFSVVGLAFLAVVFYFLYALCEEQTNNLGYKPSRNSSYWK